MKGLVNPSSRAQSLGGDGGPGAGMATRPVAAALTASR
jgi:hypothetical protein